MTIDYNRNTFAKNLIFYMKRADISSVDLSRLMNVSKAAVSAWINGKKAPRWNKIEELSRFFNISISDLIEEKSAPQKPTCVKIPVFGRVAAGVPIEAITDIIDYEEISKTLATKGEFFALKVQGDSMSPSIIDGDVAIIKKQSDCESGELAIVLINGEDSTLKRIKKRPEGIILTPSNPAYESMFFSNEDIEKLPVVILGKVVETRRRYL